MGDEIPSSPGPKITDVIDITIKTIESQNYQFQVENDIQIKALKEKVASSVGIEPDQQRMIFCGRVLADDKTLKDYKIENGRVIHLVKRAVTGQKNDTQNSANQPSNNQNRSSRNFYRSDNGSILMGTISIEPNNSFFGQLMRQIFRQPGPSTGGNGEQSGQNQSDNQNQNQNTSQTSSSVRNRLNQIRLLHAYIDSNFAILQDANHVPQPPTNTALPENHVISLSDYAEAFTTTLSYMERLKPLLDNWLQTVQNPPASGETPSNYSILMRITHHLSHIFHMLTDFSVNPTDSNHPLGLSVLRNGFPNSLLPGMMSAASNTSLSSNATNSSASSTAPVNESTNATSSGTTTSTTTTPTGFTINANGSSTSRVETNTTSTSGGRTSSMRVPFPPGMFVAQSPILLMEVDSTLNPGGSRGRGPTMSINDINLSWGSNWGDMPEDLDYPSFGSEAFLNFRNRNQASQTPSTTATSNTRTTEGNNSSAPSSSAPSAPTASVTSSSSNATPSSASVPPSTTSAPTGNAPSALNAAGTSNNRNETNPSFNPFHLFASGFDPYLPCNSNYSVPEVRSASIRMAGPGGIMLDDMASSPFRNADEMFSFGSPMDSSMLNGLIDLVSSSDFSNPMSDTDVNDAVEFYDMVQFLNRRLGQTNSEQPAPTNSERSRDFQRSLDLFNNQNFLSDILSVVFRNSNIIDLLNIFNMSFSNLNRFRQPFQEFVRQNLLEGEEWTEANLRRAIESYVASNRDSFSSVIADIRVNPNIDAARSLEKFAVESIIGIFNTIMSAASDESFGNSLISELKRFVLALVRLCRACFVEPEPALRQVVSNYFELYADYFNERMRNFISSMVMNRITNWVQILEAEQQRNPSSSNDSSIDAYIVPVSCPATAPEPSPEVPMQTEVEEESGSISEDVDFADAVSEMPSTSTSFKSCPDTEDNNDLVEQPSNWQNVVPSEWVPIIKEDIEKQKNIDKKHQQPFSEAYLNGMPKKRRLEHSTQDPSPDGSKVKKP